MFLPSCNAFLKLQHQLDTCPQRARRPLQPTQSAQKQLLYSIHFLTPTRRITTVSRATQNVSIFGHFSQFQCFQVFPGHFSAPMDLPGRSFPLYEVDTYFPMLLDHDHSSALATIYGDNFPHLSYSRIRPLWVARGP